MKMDEPNTIAYLIKETERALLGIQKETNISQQPLTSKWMGVFATLIMSPMTELFFDNSSKEEYDAWFHHLKERSFDTWTRVRMEEHDQAAYEEIE